MKASLVCIAVLLAAPVAAAQTPDYERLAVASLMKDNYKTARRNLELALENETAPVKRVELRRKIAALYIFDDDLDDAREIYQALIEEDISAGKPVDAHDHYALATIAALDDDESEIRKHLLAGDSASPRPLQAPMLHAIVWGHVDEIELVQEAKAEMEAAAAVDPTDKLAQQAAALTRSIYATKIRALDVARAELATISAPSMRAFAIAFIANSLRRDGQRAAAAGLDKEVREFKQLSIYSAVAHRMIR
jgi:hypothetical protein